MARDSIRARPTIMVVMILPDASGLRAIPSTALADAQAHADAGAEGRDADADRGSSGNGAEERDLAGFGCRSSGFSRERR